MTGVSSKVRRRLASLAVFIAAASLTTCRLSDLLTPGEIGALAGTPAELSDSAFAGSTALKQYDLSLTVEGTGERLRFAVAAELGSSWILLGPGTGTAPGTYTFSVDPAGLAAGEYADTIRFSAEGPDAKVLRVPVRFKLLPCAVTDLGTLPATVDGTLATSDCASPRFTDRFAKRYRITAQANDSVTVQLTSVAFSPSVAIERVGAPAPIAQAGTCSIVAAASCLRYVRLDAAGEYIVEATSSTARATGAFTLVVGRPRPPSAPTALAQLTVAAPAQPIAVGATIGTTQLALQAAVADPDLDSLRLEVELRSVGSAFTGAATHVSALGTGTLGIAVTGLADGTSYKWRARAVDVTGRASAWTEFGGNATDAADLTVAVPEAPAAPTALVQRKDDGVTDIALGDTTDESIVRLGATVADSDPGDQIRLEVEVRAMGVALTGTATSSSVPVPSGTEAIVVVSGLLDDVGYRWQARAVDQSGRASAWVRFSPAGETFRVALPPAELAFVVEPSVVAAGAAIAPAVQVAARDGAGATLTSFTGDVTIALGDNAESATLGGTRTVAAVAGVATFGDLTVDRVGAAFTLVATSGALGATSDPFSVTAASAQTLTFGAPPSDAVAGAVLSPAVTVVVRDAFGNVATGFNGAVSLSLAANAAGATLLGATTVTAVNGVATFGGVRVERAATGLALIASAAGFADAGSTTFTVSAAAATSLRFLTAPATTAGAGLALAPQPVVVADDAFGNRVRAAGRVVTASISAGPAATLANAQATTDANGAATFAGLAITGPSGSYTLDFASAAVTGVTSAPITLGAGGAARLALEVAPAASVANGAAFPVTPVVRLEDAAGNTVAQAGVAIGVAITSGAGTLSGTTNVLTDASGHATFTDLVITGATGARTLGFAAAGLTGVASGTITVTPGAAVELAAVAGDGQSAVAGSSVAVAPSVVVRDQSGNAVPGVAVAFAVTAGGGSVAPPGAVSTDATGIAAVTTWTLGANVGTNTLEASVDGLTGSPVIFTATGTAGGATQLVITGGDNLSGPVGTELATPHEVRVTDGNGNPVAGVTIDWSAGGGGSVAPASSVTDADGRATAVRTLGPTAGAQSTTAAAVLAGGPAQVSFALTATVGGATQMALFAGDEQADTVGATLATPLEVVVRDALNNPVPGVLISWSVLDGGGSVLPATSLTDAAGIATASWTLGTVTTPTDSTQTVRASGVGSPVNFVATSRPGAVSATQTTVAVAPATVAASRGTPALVTVTARDGFGNVVPGRAVTLAVDGTGTTIAQPAAVTSASGVTTGAVGATVIGARTIVASVDGLAVAQQPTLTVVAAPAVQLLFTAAPTTATASASFVPVPEVGVLDSLGNRNFAFTGAVTVALDANPAGGTLGGTLTRNAVAGVASFPGLSLDRAGSGYVLGASATGLAGATSGAITVTAGGVSAARSLVSTSAAALVAGEDTATITVTALDANDNPVAGAAVTLSASGDASAIEQPTVVTGADGVATGRISATVAGLRTVSASIGGVAVTATVDVTIVPAAVSAGLSTISALPTALTVGGPASTITITARDAFGNAIPGATVALAATGTGNSITQPSLTDADGVATGSVSSTAAGTKTVSATIDGVALASTVDLTVSAGAVSGATSTLAIAPDSIVAGSGSSTVTVTARDAQGNPVAGATVILAATGAGNTVTQPAAVTDAAGMATGTVVSTGAGSKTISASIGGTPVSGTATLTVVPAAVSATLSTLELSATSTAAGAPAVTATVTARDEFGNLIPGLVVELGATGTGNTLTQPSAVTDASGVAAGSIASTDAGVKVVSATVAGVPLTQTAELTVTAGTVSAAQSTLVASPDALSADGGSSTITVTARDASGNAIAGVVVSLAATGSGNTLQQPLAMTDADGVATGTLSSTVAGEKVITATVDGVAIDQADTVTVSVGAVSAATSTVAVAPDTISADGGASTITVTARDANGNLVAGQAVDLAATGSGNTLTQPAAVTDANGVATGSLASTGAGLKVVTATIGGVAVTLTDTVVVTAGALSLPLSTIEVASPTISAAVGSTVVTVTARDQHGNGVPGIAVALAATGTGNTVTQPVAVTDANGIATGSFSSTVSEAKTLSATLDGEALAATVVVTVVPDAVSVSQSTVAIAPARITADGETSTVTVTARDANGNPVAGISVAIAATGTGNEIVQPTATTDANGVATGTIGSTAVGTKTVSATVNGVAVTQTQELVVTPGAISAAVSTIVADPASITAGGAPSTITVTARDQHGNAIAGATVAVEATGTGNTLTPPAVVTDAAGATTATLASTVAETKTVSATVGGVALTATATVTVGAAALSDTASLVVAALDTFVAGSAGTAVTFTARDAYGNPIGGRQVTFTVSGTGNTLTQPAQPTNGGTGQTTGSFTSTVAEPKIITATIAGTPIVRTDTVTVVAAAVSAAQSTVAAAPASIVAGGAPSTITVTARDVHGNPVAGAAVAFAATGTGNTLTDTLATTDANGVATMALSSTVAGEKIASATVAGVAVTQTAAVTVTPGSVSAAQSSVETSTTSLVAGTEQATITVTARDASGNAVAGVEVVLSATGAGNTVTQPIAFTDANGVATGTISSTASGDKVVSATIDGVLAAQTQTIAVAPAAVSATASTIGAAPATIAAGGAQSTITVTVRDEFGNAVPGATVVLAATGDGNTLTQPPVTDAAGVATGTLSSTTVGDKVVSATANGVALSTTTTVTVSAGNVSATLSSVAVAPGSISADGGAATVTITARDANGNPIAGATVGFTATGDGNALTQPAAVTDANGVATGSISSTGAGTKTIAATIDGTLVTPTADLVVTPGVVTAAQSTVAALPASIVAGGTASTITITARDQHGNPVAGASVSLSATGTNTVTQPSGVTAADGTITGSLASEQAGEKVVTATIGLVTVAQTATVTVTPAAVSAAQSTVAVSAATIAAGTGSSTVTVTVRDAFDNPVPGATVAFSGTGTGNTLTPASAATDANGVATSVFTSTVSESKTISAVAAGVAITQTQAIEVVPDAPSASESSVEISAATIVAGTETTTITVTARDESGNPVSGVTVVIAATGSGNTITQPTDTTGADGIAVGTLSSTVAESKIILATVNGVGVSQTQGVTVTPAALSADSSSVVAAPNSLSADGGASTITITARDGFGNVLAGLPATFAATGDGNTPTQPVGVTGANGQITGSFSSTGAGAKIITASINGTVVTRTDTITVEPGAISATTTTVVADPTTLTAGSGSSTITVTVRDQHGNAIAGRSVSLAATGTGNTLTQPSVVTDANGVTSGTLASVGAGDKVVSATVNTVAITQTATVSVTAGGVSAANTTVTADPITLTAGTGSSTITVTARDANDNPIAGLAVSLVATGTGNTLTQPVGLTDANGVATGSLASTGAGVKTITATVGSTEITQTAAVTVSADVLSDTASLVVAASNSFAAGAGTSVTFTARDRFGNPLSGLDVSFAVSGAGNTLTQPAAATDANGEATGSFTSTIVGEKIVTATIDGTPIVRTDTVTVTTGAVSADSTTVTASPTSITTDGETSTITVTARDAGGNLVEGATVVLALTGSGVLTQPAATDALGVATGSFSSTTPGANSISATVGGVAVTQVAAITVAPGAASTATTQITASPFEITTSGSSTIIVHLRDAANNSLEAGIAEPVALSTTHGLLSAITDVGNGTYSATLTATTPGTAAISGTIDGVAIDDTATVTVSVGPASPATTQITASAATMTTDESVTVTVQLRDAVGNALSAPGGTVELATTRGALSAVIDNLDGTYSATLTADTSAPGTATITGTLDAVAITDDATVTITVGAASPATTQITASPFAMTTSDTSTIIVHLRDGANNALETGIPQPVELATTHGVLSTITDVGNGTYSALLTATTPGTAAISGTIGGVAITDTATVTVSLGAASPATTQITADSASITTDGATVIVVQLRDAAGNDLTASGGTVALNTTLGDLSAVTDVGDGTYTAILTAAAAAPGTATITGTLNSAAITDDATVTIGVGAVSASQSTVTVLPASITASAAGGSGSTITVTARDAADNLIPGAAVSLAADGSNNDFAPPSGVTDANGVYTSVLTSTTAELKTITATAGGIAITAQPTISVTPAAATALVVTTESTNVIAGDAITPAIVVEARDQFGNVDTAFTGTVSIAIETGTGTAGAALTASTASVSAVAGIATFDNIRIDSVGTGYQLRVTATGLADAVTAAFDVSVGAVSLEMSLVEVSPAEISLLQTATFTVRARDAQGNTVLGGGLSVAFSLQDDGSSNGVISDVTVNPDGSYSATFSPTIAGTPNTVRASINTGLITRTPAPTITVTIVD